MEAMQNDVITMPNMSKGMSTIEVWKNRMPITKGTIKEKVSSQSCTGIHLSFLQKPLH